MRAVYLPEITLTLTGDSYHHLANVVRTEVGDEVLLLNGKGLQVKTKVHSISKKEVLLEELERQQVERSYVMDLALGIPKKDALELTLKQATELGFRKVYLVRAEYSQQKIPERLDRLMGSALEQSNAPFLPELIVCNWDEIAWQDSPMKLMLDSQTKTSDLVKEKSASMLVVGPEGGFSPGETTYLHGVPGMNIMRLPTPILRTPTAMAAGAGILLGLTSFR